MRGVRSRSLCVVALLLVTCSEEVRNDEACSHYATALCARYQACSSGFVAMTFGDEATCRSRLTQLCAPVLVAPATSLTGQQAEECASTLPSVSCQILFDGPLPEVCRWRAGGLAAGAACGHDAQCQGRYCKIAEGQACGVCATRVGAGGPCAVKAECEDGLTCANKTCVAPLVLGASCGPVRPCQATLQCSAGTCVKPGGLGGPCDPLKGECDILGGFTCDAKTRLCAPITLAKAGQPCGVVAGGLAVCTAGGFCQPPLSGNCIAAAQDGAPCDATNGPKCLLPARCVAGVCKLDDPASCK